MKIFIRSNIFFFILFVFCGNLAAKQTVNIEYTLSFPEPHTHYLAAEMKVKGLEESFFDVKMPVWIPGSYLVREFSKSVEGFSAENTVGEDLKFHKINKNTWRVYSKKSSEVIIKYKVYASESSVRTTFVDADRAFINGSSVFMFIDGMKDVPMTVTVIPYSDWKKVTTALPKIDGGSFQYRAENYDISADAPIAVGNHEVWEFNAEGVQHFIVVTGSGNYNKDVIIKDYRRIVKACTDVFGENPNKSYTFFINNRSAGGGGLEHLTSTTLQVDRNTYFPIDKYIGFLSLSTHEYFHLWNVKRLRPEPLGPFDYDKENYTSLLWFAEGFTSYYDELLLRRIGILNDIDYLKKQASAMSAVANQPGGAVQSLSEASFDAWIKAYRPDENSYNTTISYYTKGALIALLLDLKIIHLTNGKKNLDDLMRYMYQEYYTKKNRGFTDGEFRKAAAKIAGKNLDQFFDDYIDGTKSPEYDKYLELAGYIITDLNSLSPKVFFGTVNEQKDGKLAVKSVLRNASAYNAGINAGDEIIAVDGMRISDDKALNALIDQKSPEETIEVVVSRDGIIKILKVKLLRDTRSVFLIYPINDPSEKQLRVRKKWLENE